MVVDSSIIYSRSLIGQWALSGPAMVQYEQGSVTEKRGGQRPSPGSGENCVTRLLPFRFGTVRFDGWHSCDFGETCTTPAFSISDTYM